MEKNKACPCPHKHCLRHGKCDKCRAHHSARGELPYCEQQKQNAGTGPKS